MPILLKRRNGEITPFRNADFIPAFYFIPKSILDKCGAELNSIPRNPRKILQSWGAIAMVESDLFLLAIIDAYAYMVWPFMGLGAKREIYSGMSRLGFLPTQRHTGFRNYRMKRFFRQQRNC